MSVLSLLINLLFVSLFICLFSVLSFSLIICLFSLSLSSSSSPSYFILSHCLPPSLFISLFVSFSLPLHRYIYKPLALSQLPHPLFISLYLSCPLYFFISLYCISLSHSVFAISSLSLCCIILSFSSLCRLTYSLSSADSTPQTWYDGPTVCHCAADANQTRSKLKTQPCNYLY